MDSEPEESYDHLHRYAYDEMTSLHDKIKHLIMDERGAHRGLLPEVGVVFFFSGVATLVSCLCSSP